MHVVAYGTQSGLSETSARLSAFGARSGHTGTAGMTRMTHCRRRRSSLLALRYSYSINSSALSRIDVGTEARLGGRHIEYGLVFPTIAQADSFRSDAICKRRRVGYAGLWFRGKFAFG